MPGVAIQKIEVYHCRCEQCGHEWTTRGLDLPRRCPNHACRSARWKTKKRRVRRLP
jgi:predicted Zn-ribbon and HTH transcriptional regulator